MSNQKIVVVTGANSGIGKEAALRFAKEGCAVVMACRDIEKSEKVQGEIIAGSMNEDVFLYQVDMSSFESINKFCEVFKSDFPKLDILINNAAYFNHGEKYRLSQDGIELTFATNVLGPFLITSLLLEHLKKSDNPKVLNSSSTIIKHFFSPEKKLEFKNLQGVEDEKHKHSVYATYRDSKMALLILTLKMAEEYKECGVKVNALQINGVKVSKETLKKFNWQWRSIAWVQNFIFPLPEFMANCYFEICTSDRFNEETGRLFNPKLEIMEPSGEAPKVSEMFGDKAFPGYAMRMDVREKLWELCQGFTRRYLGDGSDPEAVLDKAS